MDLIVQIFSPGDVGKCTDNVNIPYTYHVPVLCHTHGIHNVFYKVTITISLQLLLIVCLFDLIQKHTQAPS